MVISMLIVSPSVAWGRLRGLRRRRPGARSDQLARRPPHELSDPRLLGGGQLLQRKRGRPHGALVEVRLVAEVERRVPRAELPGALEVAHHLAALVGVGGHPVPGSRPEVRRAGLDDLVDPPGHGAVRFLHFGDLRQHGALPRRPVLVRALFGLQLFCALPHRGPLLGREPFVGLLRAHRSLPCGFFLVRSLEEVYPRLRARTSPFLIGLVTRFATKGRLPRSPSARSSRNAPRPKFAECPFHTKILPRRLQPLADFGWWGPRAAKAPERYSERARSAASR